MPRYSERQKAALDALMKDDVYHHAMEVIKSEGQGALTMERIATDVGVSRGTLYNYFADRDAVIDYLEERTFAPLLHAVEEVAGSALSPEKKLTEIAGWVFSAVYRDSALVVALVPVKSPAANQEAQERRRASGLAVLERVMREGVENGSFNDLPPRLVAEIFFSAIAGLIDVMAFSGRFQPPEEVVPTLMQVFLGGLCR
jgi:AcrR family transcriptional regulator